MATTNLRADSTTANSDFRDRMFHHETNGVRQLYEWPQDAALTLTEQIHAVALLLGHAHRKTEDGSCNPTTDNLNPEIIAGCCAAISHMAALANFYISETELGYSR